MSRRIYFRKIIIILLFCTSHLFAQDQVFKMEEQLFQQLYSLQIKSHNLTEDLKQLQEELHLSNEVIDNLESQLDSVLDNYNKVAQKLINTESQLKQTKTKLHRLWAFTIGFIVLLILAKVFCIFMRWKGFPLPSILEILL